VTGRADTSNRLFDTMAIIGVGLIGGSLGMAARRRGLVGRVIGIGRSEQKLMRAKILAAIDDYTLEMGTGVSEADLVIICTPVRLVAPTLKVIAPFLKPGAVITDVGSTKREIVEQCEAVTPDGCFFVGGHPMAGSEQVGVEAAAHDLFVGATYVVTHSAHTDLSSLGQVAKFAEAVGADIEIMTPEEHDAAVAIISHLPHVMSGALLQTAEAAQRVSGKTFQLAAGSFRDLTRISASSPDIWRDICITNPDCIRDAIVRFQAYLDKFKAVLDARDEDGIRRFFEQASEIREAFVRIAK